MTDLNGEVIITSSEQWSRSSERRDTGTATSKIGRYSCQTRNGGVAVLPLSGRLRRISTAIQTSTIAFYSTKNENCDAFPDGDSAMVTKLSDLLSAGSGGKGPCLTAIHFGSAEERLTFCTIRGVTGIFFGSSYSLVSCHIK